MRYTTEEKESLLHDAKANGFRNSASYVKFLIKQNTNNKPRPETEKKELASYWAQTRLNQSEKKLLKKRATEEGVSESFIVLQQLKIFLTQEPHFTKNEIQALRNATRYISALGRNLNQIARAINRKEFNNEKINEFEINELKNALDLHIQELFNLIGKNRDRSV